MSDQEELALGAPQARSHTRTGVKIALVAAGIAAGAIGATALGANAATSGSGSVPTYAAAATPANGAAPADGAVPANGAAPGNGDGARGGAPGGRNPNEKPLDATLTAKLKAAALAKVPGATVDRIESDSGDATYEAHLTKSDGTRVTVKFDKSGAVTGVEDGMGK